jgi:hypothetical protein
MQRLRVNVVKGAVIKIIVPGASGTQFQVKRNGPKSWCESVAVI